MATPFAAGASASLNKSITALMDFLHENGKRPSGRLRPALEKLLAQLAKKWYRKGFNRGHRESAEQTKGTRVPTMLHFDATREFFTDNRSSVRLKSRLKRKHQKRHRD